MAAGARLTGPVCVDDGYFSLAELSKYGGLSVRTLRSHLTNQFRPLPHYRVGGKILVRRTEFDAWVSQFKVACATVSVDSLVDDVVGMMR